MDVILNRQGVNFNVAVGANVINMNTVYEDRDKAMCEIIANAFKEVGYRFHDLSIVQDEIDEQLAEDKENEK